MLSAPKLHVAKEDGRGAFGYVTTNCKHPNENAVCRMQAEDTHEARVVVAPTYTYSRGR